MNHVMEAEMVPLNVSVKYNLGVNDKCKLVQNLSIQIIYINLQYMVIISIYLVGHFESRKGHRAWYTVSSI